MPHPVTGKPVFFQSDYVHCLKKGWSSLDKSSKRGDAAQAHHTRSMLKYEMVDGKEVECHLSLRQGHDIWQKRTQRANAYGLAYHRKLTAAHFRPDPSMKMRVSPAAHVLSATMGRWTRDEIRETGNLYHTSLAMFFEKWNDWFDLMNGKHGPIWGPDDPKVQPSPLLHCAVDRSLRPVPAPYAAA